MFGKTMVRGSTAAAVMAVLIVALSVSSVAWGQTVLSLTTAGVGSVTIPAGYEWTDVTVQCWGGGGGGSYIYVTSEGGGGSFGGPGVGGTVNAGAGHSGGPGGYGDN